MNDLIDTQLWCRRSVAALVSLWNHETGSAFRNSLEKAKGTGDLRPTVSFNALVAFEKYGLLGDQPLFDIERPNLGPFASSLFEGNWYENLKQKSAHRKGMRGLIYASHALRCASSLLPYVDQFGVDPNALREGAEDAADSIVATIRSLFESDVSPAQMAARFRIEPTLAAVLLYYAQSGIYSWRRISGPNGYERVEQLRLALDFYFEHEVDRLMARRFVAGEPGFDPAALTFSARGLLLSRPQLNATYFFRNVVEAVAQAQNQDGTWADGVCAMIEDGADTLQQPSTKIAAALSEAVFSSGMLVGESETVIATAESAIACLRRFGRFLTSTYWQGPNASGWSSDRVRWQGTSETWITALVARFFLKLHFTEVALERAKVLHDFGATRPQQESIDVRRARWERIDEPDAIVRPKQTIQRAIIEPILRRQEGKGLVVRPDQNGTSLLLFGPPGSGKTFWVSEIARVLGWPLIELNPSSFVAGGTELIESRASDVFRKLMRINHAVVFFDECDELFRSREAEDGRGRNIMTFITAAMLPKLQQLHDIRSVVFVVATNYLSRIDKAIRRPGRFDEVLLLDRPDDACRRVVLSKRNIDQTLLDPAVAASKGVTIKELFDYARVSPFQALIPAGSQQDYVEWCKVDGPKELEASRSNAADRGRIKARWPVSD